MTEPGKVELSEPKAVFINRDVRVEKFFDGFKANPQGVKELMDQVSADRHMNFDSQLREGLKWDPHFQIHRGDGRVILKPFDVGLDAFGAKTLKAAMNYTLTDEQTGKVSILYPRFNRSGQFDPTDSKILDLEKWQADSLEEFLAKGLPVIDNRPKVK